MTKITESRLVLFGSNTDPEVKESIRQAKKTGRKIEVAPRPSFDTGLGQCGKHLCNCKAICKKEYAVNVPGAYPGDSGPVMGKSF